MEFIYIFTNGDMFRIEEVFEKNAHHVLNIVEYLMRKNRIEQKSLKNKNLI